MKIAPRRAFPAISVALAALLVVAASGFASNPGSTQTRPAVQDLAFANDASPLRAEASARRGGKFRLRFGKLVDTDTTAHDGIFNYAQGRAACKRNERLISGGLRLHRGSISFIVGHFSMVESGPVPKLRQWVVTASSDLGGAARKFFLVVAYCRSN